VCKIPGVTGAELENVSVGRAFDHWQRRKSSLPGAGPDSCLCDRLQKPRQLAARDPPDGAASTQRPLGASPGRGPYGHAAMDSDEEPAGAAPEAPVAAAQCAAAAAAQGAAAAAVPGDSRGGKGAESQQPQPQLPPQQGPDAQAPQSPRGAKRRKTKPPVRTGVTDEPPPPPKPQRQQQQQRWGISTLPPGSPTASQTVPLSYEASADEVAELDVDDAEDGALLGSGAAGGSHGGGHSSGGVTPAEASPTGVPTDPWASIPTPEDSAMGVTRSTGIKLEQQRWRQQQLSPRRRGAGHDGEQPAPLQPQPPGSPRAARKECAQPLGQPQWQKQDVIELSDVTSIGSGHSKGSRRRPRDAISHDADSGRPGASKSGDQAEQQEDAQRAGGVGHGSSNGGLQNGHGHSRGGGAANGVASPPTSPRKKQRGGSGGKAATPSPVKREKFPGSKGFMEMNGAR